MKYQTKFIKPLSQKRRKIKLYEKLQITKHKCIQHLQIPKTDYKYLITK